MLKVERTKSQIKVSLRERLKSFDRTFFVAFSIATLLHLTGFILFQVQPFKLKSVETIFPPVAVNIDFQKASNRSILTNLEENRLHHSKIEKPILSKPKLSSIQPRLRSTNLLYQRTTTDQLDPFRAYEAEIEKASLVALNKGGITPKAFIISGPLGDKEWKNKQALPSITEQLAYQVKIDDQKGRVISIEQLQGKQNLEIEKYLSAIQFHKDINGFITSGIIEIFPGVR